MPESNHYWIIRGCCSTSNCDPAPRRDSCAVSQLLHLPQPAREVAPCRACEVCGYGECGATAVGGRATQEGSAGGRYKHVCVY